jgi:hypothetical protein
MRLKGGEKADQQGALRLKKRQGSQFPEFCLIHTKLGYNGASSPEMPIGICKKNPQSILSLANILGKRAS